MVGVFVMFVRAERIEILLGGAEDCNAVNNH